LPGGPARTADLVAALADPATSEPPWLPLLEFQAQEDPDEVDVTLEEVGILRSRARHGDNRKGKYRVLAGIVQLVGRCPEPVVDMVVEGGTWHGPLIWNIEEDDAAAVLEAVMTDTVSWGMLFWVALMTGADSEAVLRRWRELVLAKVADPKMRGNLAGVALQFAELSGRRVVWM
jgi:hypothetical protein